jgi:hypothetical protein
VSGLTLLQGTVLDMVAEGKSPRAIAEVLGIQPSEAAKMAYDLLDNEINTDIDQRRKLNVYRLEKIVEALWQRVMNSAQKDDVKNLVDVLDKLNVLLGLNKEQDAEAVVKASQFQLQAYMSALVGLLAAFKALAPKLMTEDEWAAFAADQLVIAEQRMKLGEIEQ